MPLVHWSFNDGSNSSASAADISGLSASLTGGASFGGPGAFVKRGSTLELYIDGEFDGTTNDATTGNTTNNSPLYLGRRGGGAANWFTGAIDDLRVYNAGRSAAEIAQLASQTL